MKTAKEVVDEVAAAVFGRSEKSPAEVVIAARREVLEEAAVRMRKHFGHGSGFEQVIRAFADEVANGKG
jgi:hypothetical protein